jgi:hypothetical protein
MTQTPRVPKGLLKLTLQPHTVPILTNKKKKKHCGPPLEVVEDPGMLLPKAVEDPAQQHAPAKGSRRSHTSSHQKGERPMAKSTLKLNKHNTTTVSHLVPDPIPGTNPLTFSLFLSKHRMMTCEDAITPMPTSRHPK